MERLKRVVSEIAYTKDLTKLSLAHRSVIPLLSAASSFYSLSLSMRHQLYLLGIFRKNRLPVPVISVGNLTWGGNGKTPMVYIREEKHSSNSLQLKHGSGEPQGSFRWGVIWVIASTMAPLVQHLRHFQLSATGYAGGDEARMLARHLLGTSAKIGIGADRAMTASRFLERYGYVDPCSNGFLKNLLSEKKVQTDVSSNKIGAAILDDGMQEGRRGRKERKKIAGNEMKMLSVTGQHIGLSRDLEIVMVNALRPWGNNQLLPLGPLREPLHALVRADIVVVHHADLVSEQYLIKLKLWIQEMKETLPVFFSRMAPSHFLTIQDIHMEMPLSAVENRILLCVSAIGSPDAFVKCIEKLGPVHVDELRYSDHYSFQTKDIVTMKKRLEQLQHHFGSRPVVVVTEKDYDRDHDIFVRLHPFDVLVLCSRLKFMPCHGSSEESFKELVKQLLDG
ncbi:hypothetical protein Cgig2_019535 [Carnegiea gigantea]|uniref:tetraacyldisaccharide 4'-kinase n=1 Tax=Carnegiea gigantea TaxID=171969 RepID=A0A9Q1QI14_9CARY|nr:hypothetical protein Cgig2_019535 [Carnegiea gigantea]